MRALSVFFALVFFALGLSAQTTEVVNGVNIPVGDTAGGGFRLIVKNAEQYFKYMDLDHIYISPVYGGSPGYFVYSEYDRDNDGNPEAPAIGVYFKGETGLTLDQPYNNDAPAYDVSSGYSCTLDANANTARMDAAAINGHTLYPHEIGNEQTDGQKAAKMALNDYMSGYRIVDLVKSDYFGRCEAGKLLDRDSWVYKTVIVFEWNSMKDYIADKKADIVHIDITPGGYGIFSFHRSQGKIENIDLLKQLYRKAGFLE